MKTGSWSGLWLRTFAVIALGGFSVNASAQLEIFERLVMPGPLISDHAEYEAECASCHETPPPEHLHEMLKWYDKAPSYNRVILPLEKTHKEDKSS